MSTQHLAIRLDRLIDTDVPAMATAATHDGRYEVRMGADAITFYLVRYNDGAAAPTGWTTHPYYPDAVAALAIELRRDEDKEMGY